MGKFWEYTRRCLILLIVAAMVLSIPVQAFSTGDVSVGTVAPSDSGIVLDTSPTDPSAASSKPTQGGGETAEPTVPSESGSETIQAPESSEGSGETAEPTVPSEGSGETPQAPEPSEGSGETPQAPEPSEGSGETTQAPVPTEDGGETTDPTDPSEDGEAAQEPETVYTLRLTHYFWFTVGGQSRNVQSEQLLELTGADFTDGVCALSRFSCVHEKLTLTEAGAISLADFDENHCAASEIAYQVAEGWMLVPKEQASTLALEGASQDTFQGSPLEDYEFVPANVVRLNMRYEYSKTGGLAGSDAANPQILEVIPTKQADGSYMIRDIALPIVEGFRIVMNPAPLNVYLINPPTGNETPEQLEQMWQNGSFNGNVAAHQIYAYQVPDINAEPDFSVMNPTYDNIYSDQYNESWNKARHLITTDYTAWVYCADNTHTGHRPDNHGVNALPAPRLQITLTEDQLNAAAENGLTITVSYRRVVSWYTVKHWVPEGSLTQEQIAGASETAVVGGVTYRCLDTERLQGRQGALTRASARTGGVYDVLNAQPFAQQLITNGAVNGTTGTVVDIYYSTAESYRVIFNTDYTYIPRQTIPVGGDVDFSKATTPTRKGYTFGGWQYLKKNAAPDADGNYAAADYERVNEITVTDDAGQEKTGYQLTIDTEFVSHKVKLQEMDGVPMIHLYPIWEPAETTVTVVFWTEDLTGTDDDIEAFAQGGVHDYYDGKYAKYAGPVVTRGYGDPDASFSNAGSFTMSVLTDSALADAQSGRTELISEIQAQVDAKFKAEMGSYEDQGTKYKSVFFAQNAVRVFNGADGSATTTASPDGDTTIHVYFTRNVYTLKFFYYGSDNGRDTAARSTNPYSDNAGTNVLTADGKLNIGATWERSTVKEGETIPTPEVITIRAKYGADLRNVWPAARGSERFIEDTNSANIQMVSWATTQGKYRNDGYYNVSHPGEKTIMGLFATMDEEIIADPEHPNTVHNLVAYWWYRSNLSYYRYNHCFELPSLTLDGAIEISLYNNSDNPGQLKDKLYLVPVDNETVTKFGFTDLMKADYNASTGEVTYGAENGQYYAVRGYNGKYYAVGRRLVAISSNNIRSQNPSARLHLSRVNNVADHTSQYGDDAGRIWYEGDIPLGSVEAPYDLFFYYDRDRYDITYKVPSTHATEAAELGHISLPYGAHVTRQNYAFVLDCVDTNQAQTADNKHKYLWSYPEGDARPVCPDRNPAGAQMWQFQGWALGPTGQNMYWPADGTSYPSLFGADDFYIDDNLDLYAIWKAPQLTVTFHLNGGAYNNTTADFVSTVPANTIFTAKGTIPRPVRQGHQLVGWYVSDNNGNIRLDDNGAMTPFEFDWPVINHIHVAAKWTAVTNKLYDYTVYYLTQTLTPGQGVPEEQVWVKDNMVYPQEQPNATAYYVLGKVTKEDQVYTDALVLNLTAKAFTGYTPQQTNQSLTVSEQKEGSDPNIVIFTYAPQTTGDYTVKFVRAGTESSPSPTVVQQYPVKADSAVMTPTNAMVNSLLDKGYRLVNRSGAGYVAVNDYTELQWTDENGTLHTGKFDNPEAFPKTAAFLVEPIPYTVTYVNAAGSPDGAAAALAAVTAEANKRPVDAGDKNPTQYTTEDESFTLHNPERFYNRADRTWYAFAGWALGTGTTGSISDSKAVTVNQGSVGNLTFVANWEPALLGSLSVSKTVTGAYGNRQKEFTFTVTLTDNIPIQGTYGDMTFVDGIATIYLKHGETKTATGLPAGIGYTVTEQHDAGYTTTSTGDTGTITKDATATAAFVNAHIDSPPPTGVRSGVDPTRMVAVLILAVLGMGAVIVTGSRRRRGGWEV